MAAKKVSISSNISSWLLFRRKRLIKQVLTPPFVAVSDEPHQLPGGMQSERPRPESGRLCCYCNGSNTPPNSPTKTARRAILAPRDPASAPNWGRPVHRTGRYSGHAAKYFSAIKPGSAAEYAGTPANELPTALDAHAPRSALPSCAFPPPAPRPSTAAPSRAAPPSH